MMGPQTPVPAGARPPIPAIWPMNIRSTMLYRTLISWASMVGTASRSSRLGIGSRPKSFFFFKDILPSQGKAPAEDFACGLHYTGSGGKVKGQEMGNPIGGVSRRECRGCRKDNNKAGFA